MGTWKRAEQWCEQCSRRNIKPDEVTLLRAPRNILNEENHESVSQGCCLYMCVCVRGLGIKQVKSRSKCLGTIDNVRVCAV